MNDSILVIKENSILKVTFEGEVMALCESFGECIRTASAVIRSLERGGIMVKLRIGQSAEKEFREWSLDPIIATMLPVFHPLLSVLVVGS